MKQELLLSMLMLALIPMALTAKNKLEKKVTVTTTAHVGGIALNKNVTSYETAPCFCANVGNTYTISTLGTDGLTTVAEFTLPNSNYKLEVFRSFSNQDDDLAGIYVYNGTADPIHLFCFTTNTSYVTGNTIIVNNEGKILYSGAWKWFYYSSELECIGFEKPATDDKSASTYTFIPIADLISGNASEVEDVTDNKAATTRSKVYNLQGMEVDENTKGIVIKDGNAILNK